MTSLPVLPTLLLLSNEKGTADQPVEPYRTQWVLSFKLIYQDDPTQAIFVQFNAPLKHFTETMTFIARSHFSPEIGQIRTLNGHKPQQVAHLQDNGSINSFYPFPHEYKTFVASPYRLKNRMYAKHGVEAFFQDVAQSERFSTLYHQSNLILAPRDYKDELIRGSGVLPYFHVGGDEWKEVLVGRRINLIRYLFVVVDIFQDMNQKTILVIKRLPTPSTTEHQTV